MDKSLPWSADLGNGKYKNPILYADYSDPDVVRVKDDYFLVASSFNMSPGLPILHSKDLVNWRIINHVTDTFPDVSYDRVRHGDGLWAPSIRYHDGWFWVFVGCPDEGIFMSKTRDPFSDWSTLHLVKKASGWIDPCPFWDDDGKAYLVHAFARSRIGFKHLLQLCEMSRDGQHLLSDGVIIFNGEQDHPTIEGPKVYKRNGYYYIFAPAGGVEHGWQTILRSKNIKGPFEDKKVLHQGLTKTNGPHQGGWVDTESGQDWFIHFQDKAAYGRITHLQPMKWGDDEWPKIGEQIDESGIGIPVDEWEKPNTGKYYQIEAPQMSDQFTGNKLGLQWQWRANQKKEWYQLNEGYLTLFAKEQPLGIHTLYDTPQILTQKVPAPSCTVSLKVDFQPEKIGDTFAFVLLGYTYHSLIVVKEEYSTSLYYVRGDSKEKVKKENREKIAEVDDTSELHFKLLIQNEATCQFYFSEGNHNGFKPIGDVFVAEEGHWIGSQIGISCFHEKEVQGEGGRANISQFSIESLE
ncbi:glycoside hydrolase 43 family protein [Salipaludibacillus sp. HK11]|uniref:glycoside hydrolase family 43 protein n=1 Tax=Salipaludibacillus sp. HK11 TaxID=3394320 RepID=UPI0039FBDDEE